MAVRKLIGRNAQGTGLNGCRYESPQGVSEYQMQGVGERGNQHLYNLLASSRTRHLTPFEKQVNKMFSARFQFGVAVPTLVPCRSVGL